VALAKSSSNASTGLQERVAGALWGLSVSEANRCNPLNLFIYLLLHACIYINANMIIRKTLMTIFPFLFFFLIFFYQHCNWPWRWYSASNCSCTIWSWGKQFVSL